MTLEKWIIAPGETRVIDLELVRKLKVGLIGGQIDIIGHDEPGARIEVNSVSGKELKVSITGDVAEIDHPQLRWDNFIEVFKNFGSNRATAEVSVLVPRNVALTFGVVSASGLVSGLTTDAKLNTVTGDLVVDRIIGDLDVNSVSGEITVQNHEGRINANTVSGNVTGSGAITKASIDGVSSEILLDVHGPCDTIETNSVSGAITIRLDDRLAARFNTNTLSGTLSIDGTTVNSVHGKGYAAQTGTLSGQFVEVRANTVSGTITVLRRSPDATDRSYGAADADAASADTAYPSAATPTNADGPDDTAAPADASAPADPSTPTDTADAAGQAEHDGDARPNTSDESGAEA